MLLVLVLALFLELTEDKRDVHRASPDSESTTAFRRFSSAMVGTILLSGTLVSTLPVMESRVISR